MQDGVVVVVLQRDGGEHVAEGLVGRAMRRLRVGDAAQDAEQRVQRVDSTLGIGGIAGELFDAQRGGAAVERTGAGPAKAGDEIAVGFDGKLEAEELKMAVAREGKADAADTPGL